MTRARAFPWRIAISVTLCIMLVWMLRGSLADVVHTLANTRRSLYVLALLMTLCAQVFFAQRYRVVLAGQDTQLTLVQSLQLTFVGIFFNNFLPTSLGGDVIKAHYVGRVTGSRIAAYSGVLLDRFVGFAPLMLIAAVAMTLAPVPEAPALAPVIWILLLVCIVCVMMVVEPRVGSAVQMCVARLPGERIRRGLGRGVSALCSYRRQGRTIGAAISYSLLAQALLIFAIWMLSQSVGVSVSLWRLCWAVPVIFTIGMLPSVNGLGVREGAFVFCLREPLGLDAAFAVAVLWLGLLFVASLIGGAVYARYSSRWGTFEGPPSSDVQGGNV